MSNYHISLVEIKNDMLNHLTNILYSHMYETIMKLYNHSIKTTNDIKEKIDMKKNKPSELKHFIINLQSLLNISIDMHNINYDLIKQQILSKYVCEIKNRSEQEKNDQYHYIMVTTNTSTILDNLIKACFKSYLLFITTNPKTFESITETDYNDPSFYDKINVPEFVNLCYITTCVYFEKNPEIFIRKNKLIEIPEIVKNCILTAIKSSIPDYSNILQKYIEYNNTQNNDVIDEKLIHTINVIVTEKLKKMQKTSIDYNSDSLLNQIASKHKNSKVFISESNNTVHSPHNTLDSNNYIEQEINKPTKNTELNQTRKVESQPTRNAESQPTKNTELNQTRKVESQPTKNAESQPTKNTELNQTRKVESQPTRNADLQPIKNAEMQPTKNAEMQPTMNIVDQITSSEHIEKTNVDSIDPISEEETNDGVYSDDTLEEYGESENVAREPNDYKTIETFNSIKQMKRIKSKIDREDKKEYSTIMTNIDE